MVTKFVVLCYTVKRTSIVQSPEHKWDSHPAMGPAAYKLLCYILTHAVGNGGSLRSTGMTWFKLFLGHIPLHIKELAWSYVGEKNNFSLIISFFQFLLPLKN